MPGGILVDIVVAVWLRRVGETEMWSLLLLLVVPFVVASDFSLSTSSSGDEVEAVSRRCRRVMRLVLPLPLGPNRRKVGVPSLPAPELLLLAD